MRRVLFGGRKLLVTGAAVVMLAAGVATSSDGALERRALDGAGLLAAIDHIRSQRPFSGSLLVIKDGRVIAARSYGYADRVRHVRARLDTRYRISGLTTAFTWIGLLQLRDRHRLDLDASVCSFFRPCPRGWRLLTPRHLMGPSTGLRPLRPSAFAQWPPSLAAYVERLRGEPLYFRPGTLVAHNTSRYYGGSSPVFLAARLLELASGESWSAYVRRHILRPAGLTSTGFERSARDAVGYGKGHSGEVVTRPLPAPAVMPPVDLGLWSTVLDFARLDRALRAGKLLSEASMAELDTPALASDRRRGRGWGCCWLVTKQFGHAAEVHGGHGSGDGFYAAFQRFPADKALVLLFTNYGGSGPAFSVAELATSVVLGAYPAGVVVEPATLQQLGGVFTFSQHRAGRTFRVRLTVNADGGQLRATNVSGSGWGWLLGPLLASSESVFVAKYAPATVFEFVRDASGVAQTIVVRDANEGWHLEFRRSGA